MKLDREHYKALHPHMEKQWAAHEERMQDLRARVRNPAAGFFGPESMFWRVSQESILLAMGMRPLLLQIAHPHVAQGVADHSKYREEPLSRGYRTFDAVYKITFGAVDTALDVARRVYRIHGYVRGTLDEDVSGYAREYVGNEPHSLLWVHATLVDGALRAYEAMVKPLTPGEREAFYEDSKLFGYLFGVTEEVMPPTLEAFERWFAQQLNGALVVTAAGRDVGRSLMYGAQPMLRLPVRVYNAIGAVMLPSAIRTAFGMRWNLAEKVLGEAAIRSLGVAYPQLPDAVRLTPFTREALRRLGQPVGSEALDRRLLQELEKFAMGVRMQPKGAH